MTGRNSSTDNLQSEQRPVRTVRPLTAVGVLLILISLTALITYGLMTIPSKMAAQAGPPEAFRQAATQQAELAAQETLDAPEEAADGENGDNTPTPTATGGGSTTPIPPSMTPTETPNPYGEWPLPDWVDERYWLSIPAIGVESPIIALAPRERQVEGTTVFRLPVPNSYAVSWDLNTSAPGYQGNTILTGHSNLYGGVFQDLDELAYGAEIAVWSELGVFSYYVSEIVYLEENDQPLNVRYQNAQWLNDTLDDRVTLITCWPNSNSSHRLIVVGTR